MIIYLFQSYSSNDEQNTLRVELILLTSTVNMGISKILHFKWQLCKFQKFYYLQDELFYKQ